MAPGGGGWCQTRHQKKQELDTQTITRYDTERWWWSRDGGGGPGAVAVVLGRWWSRDGGGGPGAVVVQGRWRWWQYMNGRADTTQFYANSPPEALDLLHLHGWWRSHLHGVTLLPPHPHHPLKHHHHHHLVHGLQWSCV